MPSGNKMKDKICLICKLAIDMDKEFCKFEHYEKKDVIRSKAYHHVNCFRDKVLLNKAMEQKAFKLMEKTNQMLNQVIGERA